MQNVTDTIKREPITSNSVKKLSNIGVFFKISFSSSIKDLFSMFMHDGFIHC